jgi:hypothetical protein
MPLIMGEWKLFIDKNQLPLRFHSIDNHGHFLCDIQNLIPGGGIPLHGEGLWSELGKQVSFSVYTDIPNSPGNKIVYSFNGYQIEGTSSDPALDKLWTLSGTYQISTLGVFLEEIPTLLGLLVQDSRRQKLGWYAQIIEVI